MRAMIGMGMGIVGMIIGAVLITAYTHHDMAGIAVSSTVAVTYMLACGALAVYYEYK